MEPLWRFAAYAKVVGAPISIMLSIGDLPFRRTALLGTGFALVLMVTGLYFGYQSDGGEHARWAGAPTYIILAVIGTFVALPLAQVLAERGPSRLPYQRLARGGLAVVIIGQPLLAIPSGSAVSPTTGVPVCEGGSYLLPPLPSLALPNQFHVGVSAVNGPNSNIVFWFEPK